MRHLFNLSVILNFALPKKTACERPFSGVLSPPLSLIAAEFPLEALPPHITLDLPHGERPDWAPTGSDSYVFVDAPGAKPFEKNRITGEVRSILPPGCEDCQVWRVYYLPNRDYLMTIGPGRDQATIHIVDRRLEIPAWDMGVVAHEGVAVSRHSFQLAWTDGADIHYGDYDMNSTIERFIEQFMDSNHNDFFGEEEKKVEPIVEKKIPEFSFVK